MSEFGTYDWPAGDYCFLSTECPSDFQTGYIFLDEEDDIYDLDFNMSFCCRNNGLSSVPIQLPTANPFYLFRFVGDCQEVIGMTVREEYIQFDTEDTDNFDELHGSHALVFLENAYLEMRFCYYE
ncbi:uncharacterized protein LOC117328927 [Pecten maximus]|uniref:uncharacterized protein LOC117328927 n=1 Tax=Pecten maximus TaxID=6579 RepID=UPI0014586525|nr:uncharacterized protein LOC117328927 [Pecten maximus]XP_033742437.1 uncharacterized protein LOC117328927 [Pecten maximus]